jgi:glutaredoxin
MNATLLYYSKPDCPLCEKSWPVAERLAERYQLALESVDILSDAALQRRYGERIPVLVLGDTELGWGRLSQRALERKLAEHLGGS